MTMIFSFPTIDITNFILFLDTYLLPAILVILLSTIVLIAIGGYLPELNDIGLDPALLESLARFLDGGANPGNPDSSDPDDKKNPNKPEDKPEDKDNRPDNFGMW